MTEQKRPSKDHVENPSAIASGAAINLAFALLSGALSVANIIIVSRLLQPDEVGLFALITAFVEALILLSDFGALEKFVQDRTRGRDEAYHLAFSMSLVFGGVLALSVLALAPLVARLYHQPLLWPLLSAMSYTAFTSALTMPLAIYYRGLNFLRYRAYTLGGRFTGLVVTAVLASGGYGVWSLVAGGVASLAATVIPLWLTTSIRHRWYFDTAKAREYLCFGAPVWASKVTGVITQQGAVFTISAALSMKDLGHFKLSEQIASYGFLIEVIIGQTLFPFLCRIQEEDDRLQRIFVTTSKVAMMWAAPVGMGLFVFADDLVATVLSHRWDGAQFFLKVQGAAVMFGSIAYTWDNFLKAKGKTVPTLLASLCLAGTFIVCMMPAILFYGVKGIALGMACIVGGGIILKKYFINSVFPGMPVVSVVLPELAAAAVAGGIVMVLRQEIPWNSPVAAFSFNVVVFLVAFAVLICLLEKVMIRDLYRRIVSSRAKAPA